MGLLVHSGYVSVVAEMRILLQVRIYVRVILKVVDVEVVTFVVYPLEKPHLMHYSGAIKMVLKNEDTDGN